MLTQIIQTHEKSSTSNKRNRYGTKKVRTIFGESEIKVSRDRDASFNPIAVAQENRPLEPVYLVGMNVIVFKVRKNSKVIHKSVYTAVGFCRDGKSECAY